MKNKKVEDDVRRKLSSVVASKEEILAALKSIIKDYEQ